MSISDISALKKWNSIPKDLQKKILENVYCRNCHVTTITDFSIIEDKYGIILKGKCAKCGHEVARVIENE